MRALTMAAGVRVALALAAVTALAACAEIHDADLLRVQVPAWRVPPLRNDLMPVLKKVGGVSDGWTPTVEFSTDSKLVCVWWAHDITYSHSQTLPGKCVIYDTKTGKAVADAVTSGMEMSATVAPLFPGLGWRVLYGERLSDAQAWCLDDASSRIFTARRSGKGGDKGPWQCECWDLKGNARLWVTPMPGSYVSDARLMAVGPPREGGDRDVYVVTGESTLFILDSMTGKIREGRDFGSPYVRDLMTGKMRGGRALGGPYVSDRVRCAILRRDFTNPGDVLCIFYGSHASFLPATQRLVVAESSGRRIRIFTLGSEIKPVCELNTNDPVYEPRFQAGWYTTGLVANGGQYMTVTHWFGGRGTRYCRASHDILNTSTWQSVWHCCSDPSRSDSIRSVAVSSDGKQIAVVRENRVVEIGPFDALVAPPLAGRLPNVDALKPADAVGSAAK